MPGIPSARMTPSQPLAVAVESELVPMRKSPPSAYTASTPLCSIQAVQPALDPSHDRGQGRLGIVQGQSSLSLAVEAIRSAAEVRRLV